MSNNIKLQTDSYGVNLVLSTEALFVGGGGGDANYVHTQTQVNQDYIWHVNHNLNKYCSVTVVDSNKDVIIGEIHYVDENNVTLTFTTPVWGWAYCN